MAASLLALTVVGCGKTAPVLDSATVERAIARSVLTQRGLRATVVCPSKIPRRAGLVFACTAALDVGTYPVFVTETDSSGHVRYENRLPLVALDIARVERAIARSILSQRHLRAAVSCPAEVIQRLGLRFTCTATIGGRRYPFDVVETDGNGHVRYVGRR
jgi:hypothetical protein